jgi:hypothetical protein
MREQPNERIAIDGEEGRTELERPGEGEPLESRPPSRWVQLAYDLEHYGELDAEQRGEVF